MVQQVKRPKGFPALYITISGKPLGENNKKEYKDEFGRKILLEL